MGTNLATKGAPVVDGTDPLLAAINEMIFSGEAYDSLPADEAETPEAFDRLVRQPDKTLTEWKFPAMTFEGAVAAIRLALREVEQGPGEPIVASMLRAALGFLEGRAMQ